MNITHGLRRALQINRNGLAIVYGERRKTWSEIGDRVARLAAEWGRECATPDEARQILKLAPYDK
jgi:uncharacterized protein (DUF849 family)